jgi:hypothetical protein
MKGRVRSRTHLARFLIEAIEYPGVPFQDIAWNAAKLLRSS